MTLFSRVMAFVGVLTGAIILSQPVTALAHLPFISINCVTLMLFYADKLSAMRGGSRIPESVLHAATLLAGAPAACIGRWLFNHKTRKPVFGFMSVMGILTLLMASRLLPV